MLSCNPKMWQAHAPSQLVRHGQLDSGPQAHHGGRTAKRFSSATSPSAKIPPITDHLKKCHLKKQNLNTFLTVNQANVNISEEEERKEGGRKGKKRIWLYTVSKEKLAASVFWFFITRSLREGSRQGTGFPWERKWKQKPWMRSFRGDMSSIKH